MPIPVVNEDDKIISFKERSDVKKGELYRVSALWITNSRWKVLLGLRHRTKKKNPLKWCPGVAGTVEEGESYEENIIKEAEEELGIRGVTFEEWPKIMTPLSHFTQWFLWKTEKAASDFTPDWNEMEELKWWSIEELTSLIETSPDKITTGTKMMFEIYKKTLPKIAKK